MILGHAFEPVIEALKERSDRGTSYGMPTELETQIAQLVVQMAPNIDKIRIHDLRSSLFSNTIIE